MAVPPGGGRIAPSRVRSAGVLRCAAFFVRADLLGLSVLSGSALPTHAQSSPRRIDLSASANLVGQTTGEDAIRSELVGSIDLFADLRLGPATLHVYVEGNTSPRSNGVSARIPFANMDAGTALGADGGGRVQVSELRLALPLGGRAVLHSGLMDLTGFLDVSRIANDENLFFLGQPFVNNPTIVFPDYTLATTLVVGVPRVPRGHVAVSVASSHGLADNPGVSYDELVDVGSAGKGIFAAGRFRWEGDRWSGSVGAWKSTADRSADRSARSLPTVGVFSVLGISAGVHSLDARVGLADGDARAETFFGLTYLGTVGANAVGVGVANAPALPSFVGRDGVHAEAFVRRSIRGVVHLTSSVQRLGETFLAEDVDGEVWVFGFRLSAAL